MNAGQEDVPERFARDLRQLRKRAGQPSLSDLERLSERQVKRATASDILAGNRKGLPDWRFVSAFVIACRAAARGSAGIDLADLGTVEDWKQHWDSAHSGVIGARLPGRGRTAATGEPMGAYPSPGEGPVGVTPVAGTVPARLGADRPQVYGAVPSRLPDFVGRQSWLSRIHETLTAQSRSVATVQGMPGIGKTQLAVEYVYRNMHDYGLAAWIPCHTIEAAHAAMTALAAQLGVAVEPPEESESRYAEFFDVLRRRAPSGRLLLVLDNANEPDAMQELLPPIDGHVLITSRNSRWGAYSEMLELGVFDRAESVEFIRPRLRSFAVTSAHLLADAVGDLPVLLEHAVEQPVSVRQYVERLQRDPLGLLDSQPSDYRGSVTDEWRVALGQLQERSPDSFDLLACLCYFDDEPIPMEALERGAYLQGVSLYEVLRNSLRRDRAIRMLRRAGLLRLRPEDEALEVHRVTRFVMRAVMSGREVFDAERARHDVHLLLAAADPHDPEAPANWRDYAELRGHLAQSRATDCDDDSVRRLIVNMARYLSAAGDPQAALDLADDALAQWTAPAGNASEAADACLRMRHAKAAALLACGRLEEARRLQRETLEAMRAEPGQWDSEIALLGRLTGGCDRITGNFEDARTADEESVLRHHREFSDYLPHLFPARNNMVSDLALTGRYRQAFVAARDLCRDCQEFYADDDYPTVLFQRNVLARCLWLDGRYAEAVGLLAEVRAGYDRATGAGLIDRNHPWRLAHEVDYAVAQRDHGLPIAELSALTQDMYQIRRRCWQALGSSHPQTLAATVALGGLLQRLGSSPDHAASELADVQERYRAVLPDHPYGHACRGGAAVAWHLTGERGGAAGLDPATELDDVAARLRGRVGARHPLTLAATSSLANVLAETADPARDGRAAALQLALDTHAGLAALVGREHPHALACEANAAVIRLRLGHEADTEDLMARYLAVLGSDHLDVQRFSRRELVFINFTPLPL